MKELYWKYMIQLKAWSYYLDAYLEQTYRWDKGIQIFSAIMASSSIAAWVVWKKFAFLWAALIAISQVLDAVKEKLPFESRFSVLPKMKWRVDALCDAAEYQWYQVYTGEVDEKKINELMNEFDKDIGKIKEDIIGKIYLPKRNDFQVEADRKAEEYFKNYMIKIPDRGLTSHHGMVRHIPEVNGLPLTTVKIPYPKA